jgi:hypothetical protein
MDHNQPYHETYLSEILASVKNIAMVGASPDPTKFSYGVLRVLHEQGFNMFPINKKPNLKEIRDIKVFQSLDLVDQDIDMVQVFRNSNALYGVAEEAIAVGAKVLWAQIGVFDAEAAKLAENAGMKVVMNRCPKIELFRPFWKPKLNLGI